MRSTVAVDTRAEVDTRSGAVAFEVERSGDSAAALLADSAAGQAMADSGAAITEAEVSMEVVGDSALESAAGVTRIGVIHIILTTHRITGILTLVLTFIAIPRLP